MFGNAPHLVNQRRQAMIAAWLGRLEHLVLPPTCLLCGAAGAAGLDLCAGCLRDLPRNRTACPRCATPLPLGGTGACARCRAQPPDFDRAFVPFRYQPPVDFLITRLKFGGRLTCARLLGELFAAALAERSDPLPDCIAPVPLHPRRLRERGFNQALELARAAARRCGIPLWINGLRRVRHTRPANPVGRPPAPDQSAGRVRAGCAAAWGTDRADGRCGHHRQHGGRMRAGAADRWSDGDRNLGYRPRRRRFLNSMTREAGQTMFNSSLARMDMRSGVHGGSHTSSTLTDSTPAVWRTAFSTHSGIEPATGQPGAVRVI